MIERYSRKEIKTIWEEKNKYKIWLQIEIAAAQAMEKLRVIPKGVSAKVKRKRTLKNPIHKEGLNTHYGYFPYRLNLNL